MYYTYILYSNKTNRLYFGQTANVLFRLTVHNSAQNKSTKYRIPWILLFTHAFDSRAQAMAFEKKLKNLKSHRKVLELISSKSSSSAESIFIDSSILEKLIKSLI